MIVQWNVESWGETCGPKPRGGTQAGGTVQISKAGNGLIWRGLSRSYSTSQCWERMPGLVRVSHSASDTRWVNVCRKPPNDPRKAQLRTAISAQGNRILFDETGQFSFYVKDTKCAASSRRTRTLRRAVPEKEAHELSAARSAKTATETAVDELELHTTDTPDFSAPRSNTESEETDGVRPLTPTKAAAVDTPRCRARGRVASVEVISAREFIKAGEQLGLLAIVKDTSGCAFDNAKVQWSLVQPTDGVELLANGRLTTTNTTPSGTFEVRATSGTVATTLPIRVASASEYEAIFAGTSQEAALVSIGEKAVVGVAHVLPESAHEGGDAGDAGSASSRKLTFLLVLGGVVLALAGFGWWLIRTSSGRGTVSTSQVVTVIDTKSRTKCPTCGELYPLGTRFCGTDGTRLG